MAIENLPAEHSREPLPPHNTDAEGAVLGGLLIDRDAVGRVATFLRPADFYRERNAAIFEAMLQLYERREPVDYLTLSDELQRTGRYDEIGGLVYLSSLFNEVPTSLHVEHYARIVEQASLRRKLIRAAGRIAGLGYDESLDAEKALDEAEQVLFQVAERRMSRDFQKLADVLRAYWEQLLLAADVDRLERGIPTDFKDLDKLLGGLQRSDLVIVAARPSMGKSSFALCLARNAAVRFSAKVGIFSLEMSLAQLAQRLLFSESGVDSSRLRQGILGQTERRKLADALGVLAQAPIYLDDTPNIALSELRAKARRLHHEVGLDLLVVDYLQLIQGNGRENRVGEISEISRSLKAIARELNVPVVALSQLSRAVESRSPHIPMLSDLRESGCLTGDTLVALADGRRVPIALLVGQQPEVVTLDGWRMTSRTASNVWRTGHRPVYRLTTRSGRTIRATANHPFRVLHGWRALEDLAVGDRIALPRRYPEPTGAGGWDEDRRDIKANPNNDTVPLEVWRDVKTAMQALGVSQHQMAALRGTSYGGTSHYSFAPTRQVLTHYANLLADDSLREVASADIYWDQVVAIEPDGEAEVYDMTVPGTHNFVANGMLVHNSIEQDADVVMFIYREEVYERDTENKGIAEIHVAKHRNGPTGQVSLLWLEKLTKFVDLGVDR